MVKECEVQEAQAVYGQNSSCKACEFSRLTCTVGSNPPNFHYVCRVSVESYLARGEVFFFHFIVPSRDKLTVW